MSDAPLEGLHHVSAVTGRVVDNVHFYTEVLGLRLVMETVNQDDPSSYHLFYGDMTGTPGTELIFFDMPQARDQRAGTGLITGTSLRVRGEEALRRRRKQIAEAGLNPSPVIDRHYFESVYTREPGRILIEIATDTGASFPLDEAAAGTLTLPPALESRRDEIEAQLISIESAE